MPVSPSNTNDHEGGHPHSEGATHGESDSPTTHHAGGPDVTRLGPVDTSEGGILGDEEDEAQTHRCIPVPGMPTKAEMAEHPASGHIPYRRWC